TKRSESPAWRRAFFLSDNPWLMPALPANATVDPTFRCVASDWPDAFPDSSFQIDFHSFFQRRWPSPSGQA
ncbi:MAG: hypothetical protein WD099_03075, partial [Dongiaceae bacterium]